MLLYSAIVFVLAMVVVFPALVYPAKYKVVQRLLSLVALGLALRTVISNLPAWYVDAAAYRVIALQAVAFACISMTAISFCCQGDIWIAAYRVRSAVIYFVMAWIAAVSSGVLQDQHLLEHGGTKDEPIAIHSSNSLDFAQRSNTGNLASYVNNR